jgi:hypothetical protein
MDDLDGEWQHKGATFSDKTAREEFGLTQDEIVRAIRAGKLQYREGSMYGNPGCAFSGEKWKRSSGRTTATAADPGVIPHRWDRLWPRTGTGPPETEPQRAGDLPVRVPSTGACTLAVDYEDIGFRPRRV